MYPIYAATLLRVRPGHESRGTGAESCQTKPISVVFRPGMGFRGENRAKWGQAGGRRPEAGGNWPAERFTHDAIPITKYASPRCHHLCKANPISSRARGRQMVGVERVTGMCPEMGAQSKANYRGRDGRNLKSQISNATSGSPVRQSKPMAIILFRTGISRVFLPLWQRPAKQFPPRGGIVQ